VEARLQDHNAPALRYLFNVLYFCRHAWNERLVMHQPTN
jgi:hypothetical protein